MKHLPSTLTRVKVYSSPNRFQIRSQGNIFNSASIIRRVTQFSETSASGHAGEKRTKCTNAQTYDTRKRDFGRIKERERELTPQQREPFL